MLKLDILTGSGAISGVNQAVRTCMYRNMNVAQSLATDPGIDGPACCPETSALLHTMCFLLCPTAPRAVARLRRNSRLQAEIALNNATQMVLKATEPLAEISTHAICGANSLTPTNLNVHCRITTTFQTGGSYSCSAAKVGPNRLATAGHCIFAKALVRPINTLCAVVTRVFNTS
jgi:hypothetical protein